MASPSTCEINIFKADAIERLDGCTTYNRISATIVQQRHMLVTPNATINQYKPIFAIRGNNTAKNKHGTANNEPNAHTNGSAIFVRFRNLK